MRNLGNRLRGVFVAAMLAAPACSNTPGAKSQTDAATDHLAAGAAAACTTLVPLFGGCTAAALDECAREYATFPPSMRSDIDTYAACLRTMAASFLDASVDAGCPDTYPGDLLERWWLHGGCQSQAGQVASDIGAFDPCTGTAVSCTTLTTEADCGNRYGVCSWSAGACSDLTSTPPTCSASAGACATVPGCVGIGFPSCGGTGQPVCFFSQALPGAPAL
ncbi:MAG TPA: hypothetical protein VN962_27930 [Polyangia bacterium]|nr:hypothetical protein [Polyangia bacterium]